jgi:hypothetical protein
MAKHETLKEIERAEKALEASKAKHREAFRKAIANTFEEFGLALARSPEPTGTLVIVPLADPEALELK